MAIVQVNAFFASDQFWYCNIYVQRKKSVESPLTNAKLQTPHVLQVANLSHSCLTGSYLTSWWWLGYSRMYRHCVTVCTLHQYVILLQPRVDLLLYCILKVKLVVCSRISIPKVYLFLSTQKYKWVPVRELSECLNRKLWAALNRKACNLFEELGKLDIKNSMNIG